MHCNIHHADRALNAVLRESFWQQEQRLRLNGGAGSQGKTGEGQQVQGAVGVQGQAHPGREQNGRDSRFAGTQAVPGFGPHARTVKVRKGISFPCIPASLTISHWRAQQRRLSGWLTPPQAPSNPSPSLSIPAPPQSPSVWIGTKAPRSHRTAETDGASSMFPWQRLPPTPSF